MSAPFVTPAAPGAGISFADHLGALLLVDVLGVEVGIKTVHGDSDAVSADVHVLDGPGAGDSYDSTLVFPKVLQSQLKKSIGQRVLGRLSQGSAKPGQSAPWILDAASADDVAKAEKWVASQPAANFTSAAAPF